MISSISSYPLILVCILCGANMALDLLAVPLVLRLICICVVTLIFSYKKSVTFFILFFTVIGLLRIDQRNNTDLQHVYNYLNNDCEIIAEVISYPYEKGDKIIFTLRPKQIKFSDSIYEISSGNIRAEGWKYSEIKKGDVIKFETFLEAPENFDDFDYVNYLENQNIYGVAEVPPWYELIDVERNLYLVFIGDLRTSIIEYFRKVLPEPHASLMLGMLIGTREEFEDEFAVALSNTGTAHIIAVSGFNINIIIIMLLSLAGKLPRKFINVTSFFIIFAFCSLVGFDNLPALRAMLMGYSVVIANMFGRKSMVWSTLPVAFLVMFYQNPYVIFSLSFQLSFAATLGLILISEHVSWLIPFNGTVSDELSVTIAANIATFPIIFRSFGKINFWSPLANIIVGPMIPIVMLLGVVEYLLALVNRQVAMLINYLSWLSLEYIVLAISYVSKMPYSEILIQNNLERISIAYIIILLAFIFELSYRKHVQNFTDTNPSNDINSGN
ncbi:ComEC/Rec2 family competence protein [Candidatus Dojkabacteria bacterium]|uniref:ComEC/Rec2 family competence protein n=1 Tax=Candidatus Dojkabacteria bacterium TaxID=2099670 RepID=A0A955L5M1_9BACT|nr:ComEC/Rec2 family competence protein [Candidatus Dojkabacteria bacterium]